MQSNATTAQVQNYKFSCKLYLLDCAVQSEYLITILYCNCHGLIYCNFMSPSPQKPFNEQTVLRIPGSAKTVVHVMYGVCLAGAKFIISFKKWID